MFDTTQGEKEKGKSEPRKIFESVSGGGEAKKGNITFAVVNPNRGSQIHNEKSKKEEKQKKQKKSRETNSEEVSRNENDLQKNEQLSMFYQNSQQSLGLQSLDLDESESPSESRININEIRTHSSKSQGGSDDRFKTGRWQPDEHQRFIEAILKYGNEWKKVQKHVGSRSSTQARSHAQKFFVKIKRTNLFDLDIDLNNGSIKTLQEVANQMNSDQYLNTIKKLHNIAFEKKNTSILYPNGSGKKSKKTLPSMNMANNSFISSFNSNFVGEEGGQCEESFNSQAAHAYTDHPNETILNTSLIRENRKLGTVSIQDSRFNSSELNPSFKNSLLNNSVYSLPNNSFHHNLQSNLQQSKNQNNLNNNFNNFQPPSTNQKSSQLPSNIKILSMRDEENNPFNNSFYNMENLATMNNPLSSNNKNIIINNHINNYNININPANFTQMKRPRASSLENILRENEANFNNYLNNFCSNNQKLGVDDDFSNSFLEFFKGGINGGNSGVTAVNNDPLNDNNNLNNATNELHLPNLNESFNIGNNINNLSGFNHVFKELANKNKDINNNFTNVDDSFLKWENKFSSSEHK